ncbi:hypothetical protein [Salinibaculum rarum]|uniref:hypothetical protein n=1 Tax=Salinibaculum rarum TaxID=3058903 RepID=UPI00265FB5F3|nr:hypothetical protein [Salinibaculum sp. KK48]
MNRRTQLGTALVALAILLFILPALVPVQTVLTHDTTPRTFDNRAELESEGIEIIAYENMSERGQELYVNALESDGTYRVPSGQGAPEFEYLTGKERRAAFEENPNQRHGMVAIERPEENTLPRADEPFDREPRDTSRTEDQQRRQQVQRYDLMETSAGPPPLGAVSQLLRLAAALLAVIALGVGGYLLASN